MQPLVSHLFQLPGHSAAVLAESEGVVVGNAALLVETAIALTSAHAVPDVWQNAVVAAGVAGLGASLYLVHMYVTPIKRFMQVSIC